MAADGGVYRPFPLRGDATDDGQVAPMNPARLEVGGESPVRGVGFRRNQKTGGVLVEPVNDTGPLHTADAGELSPAVMQKSGGQGSLALARAG